MRAIRNLIIFLCLLSTAFPLLAQTESIPLPDLEPITRDNITALTELTQLGDGVLTNSLAWSPDGSTLAVSGSGGIWLYDPQNMDVPRLIDVNASVTQVGYSPDGSILGYTANNNLYFLDLNGSEVATIEDSHRFVFHPNGSMLVTSIEIEEEEPEGFFHYETALQIWNWPSLEPIRVITFDTKSTQNTILDLDISPDGTWLASTVQPYIQEFLTCGNQIPQHGYAWNLQKLLNSRESGPDLFRINTTDISFSADSRYLSLFDNLGVAAYLDIWDRRTKTTIQTLHPEISDQRVFISDYDAAEFHPQDTILALAAPSPTPDSSTEIRYFNYITNEYLPRIDRINNYVSVEDIAYHPEGASLAVLGQNELWILGSRNQEITYSPIPETVFRADGQAFITWGEEHGEQIIWLEGGEIVTTIFPENFDRTHFKPEFVPNSAFILFTKISRPPHSANDAPAFVLWNYHTNALYPFPAELAPAQNYLRLAFSTDGRYLALVQSDLYIHIWEVGKAFVPGEEFRVINQEPFSYDTSYLFDFTSEHLAVIRPTGVSQDDPVRQVTIWSFANSTHAYHLGYFPHAVEVSFTQTPDQLAIIQRKGWQTVEEQHAQIIDFTTDEVLFSSNIIGRGVFTPDFRYYINQASGDLILSSIDRSSGSPVFTEAMIDVWNSGVINQFSSDQQRLLASSSDAYQCGSMDRNLYLVDTFTGETVAQISLAGRTNYYETGETALFTPDSQLLVVANGYRVELYDAVTGEVLHTLNIRHDQAAFNANQTLLFTVGDDHIVRVWGVPSPNSGVE